MMLKSVISAELYDLMIVNMSISAPVPLNFEDAWNIFLLLVHLVHVLH